MTDPLPDSELLAGLGAVYPAYRHVPKQVTPADGLALPGGYLKWYDVHRDETPISSDTRDQARDFLRGEASAGRLRLCDELGYAILHRCGEDTYYLLACTWRNANEMWQTDYQRTGDTAFRRPAQGAEHHAVQCVWELATTCHERLAWSRYLRSDRDADAKRGYLGDLYIGEA